ncbi:MAG: HXXEE domain-containing protein [Chloroflexota bacterium]
MNSFKSYIRNWYYIGGILFVALSFIVGFFGEVFNPLSRILTLSFMALLVHQFEEYALPGGFPAVFNIAWMGEKEYADRYPLNRQSSFIVNVVGGYPFYILAILFPNLIWLGLAQVLFGMLQFVIHGIVINMKMKSWYNPGLASVVFLHWPIGIYYIWYVYAHDLIQPWYWLAGIGLALLAAMVLILLPIQLLKDENSEYAFSAEEMARFHVPERMARL